MIKPYYHPDDVIKINTLYQTHPKGLSFQNLLSKFQIIANWSSKCMPLPIRLAWLKTKTGNEEYLQVSSVIIFSPLWLTVIQVGSDTNCEQVQQDEAHR